MPKRLQDWDSAFFEIITRVHHGGESRLTLETPQTCRALRNEFYKFRTLLREMANAADHIEVLVEDSNIEFKRGVSIHAIRLSEALHDSSPERDE